MRKLCPMILSLFLAVSTLFSPVISAGAVTQTSISRNQVEQRALSMINLTWTYTNSRNGLLSSSLASSVTQPAQFANLTTAQVTGIPYNWGGFDGIDSSSYNAPWSNFLDAVDKGAFTGNVNSTAGLGYISGTAGLDCSGFVQAAFNIHDYKQSTTTLLSNYFTSISLGDIQHMDILDKPGDHVAIFDSWGTLNGRSGAFTYEATPDQTYGGIQGAKKYFITMDQINSGYIPARYKYIVDDTTTPTPTPTPMPTPTPTPAPVPVQYLHPADTNTFVQIVNVTSYANFRASASTSAALIGTIPKSTILYTTAYLNGWYQVTYNGQTGWVYGSLIASVPSGQYITVKGVYQLNIRSAPRSTASVVGVLGQGQYANVIDYTSDGSWYKISINGIQGWSYSKYLSYIN